MYTCVDIDECETKPCDGVVSFPCINTDGSYYCAQCEFGWTVRKFGNRQRCFKSLPVGGFSRAQALELENYFGYAGRRK